MKDAVPGDLGLVLPLIIIASMWINDTMAYIVGSLPFIVFTLVYMVNPGYMHGFFEDQRLMVAGIGGLCWMSIGVFIMAKMVSFEI